MGLRPNKNQKASNMDNTQNDKRGQDLLMECWNKQMESDWIIERTPYSR